MMTVSRGMCSNSVRPSSPAQGEIAAGPEARGSGGRITRWSVGTRGPINGAAMTTMTRPQFTLSSIMITVAIAALAFALIGQFREALPGLIGAAVVAVPLGLMLLVWYY